MSISKQTHDGGTKEPYFDLNTFLAHQHAKDVNHMNAKGTNLLQNAVRKGRNYTNVCLALLNHLDFANLNSKDYRGRTALDCAITHRNFIVCRSILAREDFAGLKARVTPVWLEVDNGKTSRLYIQDNVAICTEICRCPRVVVSVDDSYFLHSSRNGWSAYPESTELAKMSLNNDLNKSPSKLDEPSLRETADNMDASPSTCDLVAVDFCIRSWVMLHGPCCLSPGKLAMFEQELDGKFGISSCTFAELYGEELRVYAGAIVNSIWIPVPEPNPLLINGENLSREEIMFNRNVLLSRAKPESKVFPQVTQALERGYEEVYDQGCGVGDHHRLICPSCQKPWPGPFGVGLVALVNNARCGTCIGVYGSLLRQNLLPNDTDYC